MRDRIVAVQVLRFIACTSVIVHHALALAMGASSSAACALGRHTCEVGAAGVDIFFVISGFVITLTGPLANPRPTAAIFYWRRWRRVAPTFYVLSLIFLARPNLNTPQTLATLTFWPVYGGRAVVPYLENGWSLCFEMIFYTGVTLLLTLRDLRLWVLFGGCTVASLVVLRLQSDSAALRFLANPAFLEFAIGVVLAFLWGKLRDVPPQIGACLMALAAAAFAIESAVGTGGVFVREAFIEDRSGLSRVAIFGLPSAALVSGALICGRSWGGFAVRQMERLGDASYSLYLTHPFTNVLLGHKFAGHSASPWLVIGASVGLALLSGLFVYWVVERPLTALMQGAWLRRITPTHPTLVGIPPK
jgi:exopolysaccharide production protein ExoZ